MAERATPVTILEPAGIDPDLLDHSLSLRFDLGQFDPRITFTRASTATYYDDKTVAKAEENLLLYSQDFGNAYWSKTESTITVDQAVAPDGTNSADKLADSATYNNHFCRRPINTTVNETYAISVYAKNIDGVFLNLSAYSNASSSLYAAATFNLSTGVVANTGAVGAGFSVVTSSITLVGDAWYRCVLVFKNGSASPANQLAISLSETGVIGNYGLSVYTGTGKGVYIWGAQLEQRSQVTAYTPTTTQAITKYQPVLRTAVAGAPRFDHDPLTGESLGLLIEEQRTNLLLRSDTLVPKYSGSGFSFESAVGPTGEVVTWAKLKANAVGGAWCYTSYSYATSTAYTLSVFVKSLDGNPPAFGSSSAPSIANSFALVAFGTAIDPLSYKAQSLGNGVYRVHASITSPTTIPNINTGVTKYQGNDARVFMFTGFQLEAGAFPTSYIRTEATAVTRAADNVTMTGENFSSWYRADEGTFFSESRCGGIGSGGGASTVTVGANSQNHISFGQFIPDRLRAVTAVTNNVVGANMSDSGITYPSSYYKSVGAYKKDDFAGRIANGSILLDTAGEIPVVTSMSIGSFGAAGSLYAYQNGHIKRIAYYPKRLTNAKLQALTQ